MSEGVGAFLERGAEAFMIFEYSWPSSLHQKSVIFSTRGAYIRGLGPCDPTACLSNLCVAASAALSFARKELITSQPSISTSLSHCSSWNTGLSAPDYERR